MDDIDAGQHLEQFAAEILETADSRRRIVEKARLRLGKINQLLHRMHRHIGIDGKYVGSGGKDGDRDKIFDRIERLLVDPRIDGVR